VSEYNVTLPAIEKEFHMEVIYASTDYRSIRITVEDVARPGLSLAGYFDHFEPRRLQVLGNMEWSYLNKKAPQERLVIFDRLLDYKIPALLICRSLPVDEECLDMAKKHNVSILRTDEATSTFCSNLISYLRAELAPVITRHGVLMEVYGEGLLLTGESGIGKSEAALELLKRGHRLIADDAVDIRKVNSNSLVGSAPELIRNYIELRGIGIVNVAKLFGMGSVKVTEKIDMVILLEPWDSEKVYDRMGLDNEYTDILGITVPQLTIPVKPGRNLAIIIEVASMNNRQKKMGYNAAQELMHNLGMLDETEAPPQVQVEWNKF